MRTATTKIETAANVAILITAVLVAGTLARGYMQRPRQQHPPRLKAGETLALPGVEWHAAGTVVLALQEGCHFCTESAAFYRTLVEAAHRAGTRVVALLPRDVESGRRYLASLGVGVDEVHQVSLGRIKIPGTPAVLRVDGRGRVEDIWFGKLPPHLEARVLDRLRPAPQQALCNDCSETQSRASLARAVPKP